MLPYVAATPWVCTFYLTPCRRTTAILIDGGYFIKRFRRIEPSNAYDGKRAADCLFRWAVSHLHEKSRHGNSQTNQRRDLYRIFFYDCPPLSKKMHNPISGKAIDFSKTPEALFRKELHQALLGKRKLAVRLGHLSDDAQWTLKPEKIKAERQYVFGIVFGRVRA